MKNVFVIQDMPNHDYSSAEVYGSLVFINKNDINTKFQLFGTPNNRAMMASMIDALSHFQSEDYLVLAGNPIMFAVALQYLVGKGVDVNVLKWNNRTMEYEVISYPCNVLDQINRL